MAEDENYDQADYLVITAGSWQSDPHSVEQLISGQDLIHKIRYGGIDQAWIYSNPNPIRSEKIIANLAEPISFNEEIILLGHELQAGDGQIKFTARWKNQAQNGRYFVKIRIVDEFGFEWSEQQTSLLNEVYIFPNYWLSNETPVVTYDLDYSSTIPPAEYKIFLSLGEDPGGGLLPVRQGDEFLGVEYGAGSVSLDPISADQRIQDPNVVTAEKIWFGDALQLVGYKIEPQSIVTGADLTVDLYWRADKPLPPELQLGLQLGDETPILLPLSRISTAEWQPGRIIQEKYRLPVPVDMASELMPLRISVLSQVDEAVFGRAALGEIQVMATDRRFDLPDQIPYPLTVNFEPGVSLRGFSPSKIASAPGGVLPLTLFWQSGGKTNEPVTAFVHLLDESGAIIAQVDRWPAGIPSNIWAEGQVLIDDYELEIPFEIRPGHYQLAVGLYDANSGRRFSVISRDETSVADDSFILPLDVEITP